MAIRAPFNFVPVSRRVFRPDWSDAVSHDVPFEDSESGCLSVRLTAESPIYVRNGTSRHDQEERTPEWKRFSNLDGCHFIPGTSVKGMIRNVLEILSFSALTPVNDHKYSYRDLSSASNEYLTEFRESKPRCGWLRSSDGRWLITDCGLPGRIAHRTLDTWRESALGAFFGPGGGADYRNDLDKAARRKYELFGDRSLHGRFETSSDKAGRSIATPAENGIPGQIVFTGQPGPRKEPADGKPSGKHLEFVFFDADETTSSLEVPDQVKADFLFAYFDGDPGKESLDWTTWKEELLNGAKIPVFFRTDADGAVKDLGLSYLYKLPYKKRVPECLPSAHREGRLSLAQTMFGHARQNDGLKGRVHFSHALAVGAVRELEEKREILGGPKASYYPLYLRQRGGDGRTSKYATYRDDTAEISGWKRYPVHGGEVQEPPLQNGVSERVVTEFVPLATGAEFRLKIRFHNLRKVEIGALLSSLTFHGTEACRHSLGLAKALGYGQVRLAIEDYSGAALRHTEKDYLRAFEELMCSQLCDCRHEWHTSEQVRELLAMATPRDGQAGAELRYMSLAEHAAAKTQGEYLQSYSRLPGAPTVQACTYTSQEALDQRKQAIIEASRRQRQEAQLLEAERRAEQKAAEQKQAVEEARWRREQAEKEQEAKQQHKREQLLAAGLRPLRGPEPMKGRDLASFLSSWHSNVGELSEDMRLEVKEIVRQAVRASRSSKKEMRHWQADVKRSKYWLKIADAIGGRDVARQWQKELVAASADTADA